MSTFTYHVSDEGVISPCGDTELWVVNGEDWELPVYADPYGVDGKPTHYRLRPPPEQGMTATMLRALDKRADLIRVPTESNHVIVSYEGMPSIARKAPGITPAYYINWPGTQKENPDQVDERLVPPPDETDAGKDFCAYIYRLTGVVEYAVLHLVWRAICQYGPRYLMDKKRPIEMGFCKIVPSPYRANWKGLLTAKFPGFWQKEVYLSEEFTKESTNTVLCAYATANNTCLYGLEIIPLDPWRQWANAHEGKRIATLGRVGYAENWRRSVIKLYPHLLEAFREWAKAVRLPCGQLGDGVLFGGRPIKPWVPRGRLKPSAPLDPGAGRIVIDPPSPQLKGPEATIDVSKEEAHVRELSDLRPDPRYVRLLADKGPKQDVVESEDQPGGTDGVRVFHAAESEESGGNVLAEGSGI